MYEEFEDEEEMLDAMQRLQTKMQQCRNDVLHYRLLLAEDAGQHNRQKLAEAREKLLEAEAEYRNLLNLD